MATGFAETDALNQRRRGCISAARVHRIPMGRKIVTSGKKKPLLLLECSVEGVLSDCKDRPGIWLLILSVSKPLGQHR